MKSENRPKITCWLLKKPVFDTPEERVRQKTLRDLFSTYGYNREDLEVEFPIKIGCSRKRIDIAIFYPGRKHRQRYIMAIIECKRKEKLMAPKIRGKGQLSSYLAACLNARYGKVIGLKSESWEKVVTEEGLYDLQSINDIPLRQSLNY